MPHKAIPNKFSLLACAAVAAVLTTSAQARPGSDRDGGERRGPPQQAFAACANLSEGAACGFEGRRGALEGQCVVPPRRARGLQDANRTDATSEPSDSATLVCAPDGHRSHRRGEPRDEQGSDASNHGESNLT